jgi:hypothetical protein
MRTRTIDPARLLRALCLEVEPLGRGRYQVRGGRAPHVVLVGSQGRWACNCHDAAMRPSIRCKHVLSVYLVRQLAPPVRAALREATNQTEVPRAMGVSRPSAGRAVA